MGLRGHVFDKQLFSSDCYALITDTFLDKHSGIIRGCELNHTNDSISIGDGYFVIKGRPIQEEGGTTLPVEIGDLASIFCRLICEIDMSQTNTTSELNQVSYKILESSVDYPELIQEDTTDGGKIYQFEFAKFKRTLNGIEDFVDTRSFLNFDSIYTEIENKIRDVENGSIYMLKNVVSKTLNTAGWYRVAKISDDGQMAKSLIVNINTRYSNMGNMSASVLINIAYLKYKMCLLSSSIRSQAISKVRLVNDNNETYIEVYYNGSTQNIVGVDIINQKYNTAYETDVSMLDFEPPTDTATVLDELPITTYDIGEEIPLNEYRNGKRLYKKIIDCGNIPDKTTKTIDTGLNNVTIWRKEGIAPDENGYSYGMASYKTDDYTIVYSCFNYKITITTYVSNYAKLKGYVTIWYTKN